MLGILTKDTCGNQHFDGRLLSWWLVTASTWWNCCHFKPFSFSWRMDIPMNKFWVSCQTCVQHWMLGDPTREQICCLGMHFWPLNDMICPGSPEWCHGTCCQPYRPGIWRSGDHPSLQARALRQKLYCSNEWDGCIEVYVNIDNICYIRIHIPVVPHKAVAEVSKNRKL